MLKHDILNFIIRPALKVTDLWSPSAEILVYGTGLIETDYNYLMQMGTPPNGGIGFFQMESSDYLDLYSFLRRPKNSRLFNSVLSACYYASFPMDSTVLASNIKFAALMCRCHYLRYPEALPDAKNSQALSEYHKVYYNSSLGTADAAKNAVIFQSIIDEVI